MMSFDEDAVDLGHWLLALQVDEICCRHLSRFISVTETT